MKKLLIVLAVLVLVLAWPVTLLFDEWHKFKSDDPTVWEDAIVAFELEDRKGNNPENPVVFVGSSSIRLWDSLVQDMAPVPVLQRGFGGAKFNDVVYYAERLVDVHKPAAVVVFVGTNDIQPGNAKSPDVLLASYQQFVKTVRQQQPELPIYYIAITPSQLRWEVWSIAQQTNRLISEFAAQDDNLYVIDTGQALLGSNQEPDPEFYRFDQLHLSEAGYKVWTRLIKPFVLPYAPADSSDTK